MTGAITPAPTETRSTYSETPDGFIMVQGPESPYEAGRWSVVTSLDRPNEWGVFYRLVQAECNRTTGGKQLLISEFYGNHNELKLFLEHENE